MKRNSNQNPVPKKAFVSAFVIFLVFATDQLIKSLVVKSSFSWTCNLGFAFGLLPGFLNGLIALFTIFVLIYLYLKQPEFIFRVSFALILGGGISNLVDRIVRDCVVDFIQIPLWPTTFNFADLAITLGVILIILSGFVSFPKDNEA